MKPIVIDHGSFKCRAGFAGEDNPRTQFLSLTGRQKTAESGFVNVRQVNKPFIGDRLLPLVDQLQLRYPIEHGNVTDWDDLEHIWRYLFRDQLRVDTNDHPVLLSEPARNPTLNREKVTALMFEAFDVPAFYLAQQSVLALASTGRTDGIVLDSGYSVTHIVPVKDGHSINMGNRKLDFGGSYITDQLRKRLKERGILFKSRSENIILQDIVEKHCYTAVDFDLEVGDYDNKGTNGSYQLPDGKTISLGAERFQSVELLFQPLKFGFECYGVHELINDSITKLDESIQRDLFSNIVISGGATMFPKFEERMQKEMSKFNQDAKVIAPADRHLSAWRGGATVTSLPEFLKCWITKEEYDEHGPDIVHRRCF